ncbi:MAG: hypothetical protein RR229_03280 [Oscillospiraceae bacterium]
MKKLFSLNKYSKSKKIEEAYFELKEGNGSKEVYLSSFCRENSSRERSYEAVFSVRKTVRQKAGISLIFENEEWNKSNYIFAPAALYNGNCFRSLKKEYPPMLSEEERKLCANETIISDVPRLKKDGSSVVQLSVGDLSVPCVGYFSKEKKQGWLLFFGQKNSLGDFGITISQDNDCNKARFEISAPCVRDTYKYQMCKTDFKSDDAGVSLKKGDSITFRFREYSFECQSINEFLNMFFQLRCEQNLQRKHPDAVPWSYASSLIETKYNERNWLDDGGFYKSSEANSGIYRQWQTGWVGGAINTLPGVIIGTPLTKERSKQTLDFIFEKLQHSSGFLYGVYCENKVYGDNFLNPQDSNIVMSRKNADALYFIVKQIRYLRKNGEEVKQLWENGLKSLADAFLNFYNKNGEMGQFINIELATLYVAGSASSGIASAGLALCGEYFNNKDYILVAEKLADVYYENYVKKGYTNGGPGEILACPDSESAFGLLESFVVLNAVTHNKKWLDYAVDTASICASWCVAYDYNYKKHTQFYKRFVSSTGAVWASVQNKHAAPGICTLSGASLFCLYRATGDKKYLSLCRDISHNITQFVSTPDNPIYSSYIWNDFMVPFQKLMNEKTAKFMRFMKRSNVPINNLYNKKFNLVGRINERVNLSDWEGKNNVGEIPLGSCWPEVSVLLTELEVPAVYIQKDTGFYFALDHIQCKKESFTNKELVLSLTNPTDYDATYRLFIENETEREIPIDDMSQIRFKAIEIKAHKTKLLQLER